MQAQCVLLGLLLVSDLATAVKPRNQLRNHGLDSRSELAATTGRGNMLGKPKDLDKCVQFLQKHMPKADRKSVSKADLRANAELALAARAAHPWAAQVPWRLFLNNVLPYASLDEPRDAWRLPFSRLLPSLVANATTITQAAQLLNRDLWGLWGIVFKSDQTPEIMSPTQVIDAGYASCTGLSIFLVAACRSVGIPARVAGTPSWIDYPHIHSKSRDGDGDSPGEGEGGEQQPLRHNFNNHNWVEVWDQGKWSFLGAAEYDPQGMNRTWFFPYPAKNQKPGSKLHAIYAASFSRTPECNTTFPLVWNRKWKMPGCDVTRNYLNLLPSRSAG